MSYHTVMTGRSNISSLDGYTDAVSNRTAFPLANGVISLNSEHPTWTGEYRLQPLST
jgi:hypothetical protein